MSILSRDDQLLEDTLILPKIKEFLGRYLALDISLNSGILSPNSRSYTRNYKLQHTNYINTAVEFIDVIRDGGWKYNIKSIVKCSPLSLEFINDEYVIKQIYIKRPIFMISCCEKRLPPYIKFYKNPWTKAPLTFIVKSWSDSLKGSLSECDNWIFDLPKGSIVYLISNYKICLGVNFDNNDGYDFTKGEDFDRFVEEYGKKIII